MAVPKITKVTLNMGLGPDAVNDRKVIDTAIEDLKTHFWSAASKNACKKVSSKF